jgi:hypothetical protein
LVDVPPVRIPKSRRTRRQPIWISLSLRKQILASLPFKKSTVIALEGDCYNVLTLQHIGTNPVDKVLVLKLRRWSKDATERVSRFRDTSSIGYRGSL